MQEFMFGGNAPWFTVPALVGTLFFLIRLMFMTIGMAGDLDVDDPGGDSGDAFQILSVQTLAAFAMGFGWGGLGALRGFGWEGPAVFITAVAIGVGMVWLLALLLKAMADLQSSGTIHLADCIGKEGEVYTSIPPGGRGRVRLVVGDRLRTYSAVSADATPQTPPPNAAASEGGVVTAAEEIATGTRIRVVGTTTDNSVTVIRV